MKRRRCSSRRPPPEALYLGMCIERKLGDRAGRDVVHRRSCATAIPDSAEAKAHRHGSLRVTEPQPNARRGRRRRAAGPRRPARCCGAAREAAGLSIDAVAQQLKLAPRQVQALEEDDFTPPAGPHVRARLRAQLRAARAPRSGRGARRAAGRRRGAGARCAVAAADRPDDGRAADDRSLEARLGALGDPADARRDRRRRRGVRMAASRRRRAPGAAATRPSAPRAARPRRRRPARPERRCRTRWRRQAARRQSAASPGASPDEPVDADARRDRAAGARRRGSRVAAADAPIALAFRDFSWTEVKDATGALAAVGDESRRHGAEPSSGTPPLRRRDRQRRGRDASRYSGKPVDLAPYTRQNVARFTLQVSATR